MKKLVTHNGGFHADDVMAYAILKEALARRGESWTLERTRDPEIIQQADIAFDIGFEYDPLKNRYDHHQKGRAGARENGILYASAGLVWKHFGRELCSYETVWSNIDRSLISGIDAQDNGQDVIKETYFDDIIFTQLGMYFYHFEPGPFEDSSPEVLLEKFEEASEFARGILVRVLHNFNEYEKAFQEARQVYDSASDKTVLVFPKNYQRPTWKRLSVFSEPIFVIYYTDKNNQWKVEAIPKRPESQESRKLAPEAWWGSGPRQMVEVTGVTDATFCHPSGFLFGAESLESAQRLANMALKGIEHVNRHETL